MTPTRASPEAIRAFRAAQWARPCSDPAVVSLLMLAIPTPRWCRARRGGSAWLSLVNNLAQPYDLEVGPLDPLQGREVVVVPARVGHAAEEPVAAVVGQEHPVPLQGRR